MNRKERIGISEFRVAGAPVVLVTYGLGSCLGITLYDPQLRIGGLAHTLLPSPRSGVDEGRVTKFVDTSIRLMVDEIREMGGDVGRLEAKIVGGANMFSPLHIVNEETIGSRNVRAARETLQYLGIPLHAEDVGGSHGRTVEFDLANGKVRIRSVAQGISENEI